MATYTISTLHKKSAECRDFWFKDGQVAIKTEGFRWATYTIDSDSRPEVDLANPDGFEPMAYDWELVSMDDGWFGEWEWPDDMPEAERERLQALWEDEWYEGLEGAGWSQDDSEVWLYGPLVLKNEDTGEEWAGDDNYVPADPTETVQESQPEVTDWFPMDVDPAYVGQYELQYNGSSDTWPFPSYGDWDGKKWSQNGRALNGVTGWRGLAKDPDA